MASCWSRARSLPERRHCFLSPGRTAAACAIRCCPRCQSLPWMESWEVQNPRRSRRRRSRATRCPLQMEISRHVAARNPPRNGRWRASHGCTVAMEFRTDNPCDRIDSVLGPHHHVVEHLRALPHREVGSAVESVREAKAPFEFLVLTVERGATGRVGGDRSGGGRLGGSRNAHEDAAGAQGPAVWAGDGDHRGGAGPRGRRPAGVQPRGREADVREAAAPPAPQTGDRGRAARGPVVVPGLGGR